MCHIFLRLETSGGIGRLHLPIFFIAFYLPLKKYCYIFVLLCSLKYRFSFYYLNSPKISISKLNDISVARMKTWVFLIFGYRFWWISGNDKFDPRFKFLIPKKWNDGNWQRIKNRSRGLFYEKSLCLETAPMLQKKVKS